VADGGTIFLDEIADISPKLQQTLLRVLQQKEIQPLQMKPKKVDVRVIAATNRNLPVLCKDGRFRWDLYYRLAIAELEVPSLQNRGAKEVADMIDYFLEYKMKELKKGLLLKFSSEVRKFLQNYPWPGNVRELENLIETMYVFCNDIVEMADLPARFKELPKGKSLKWKDIEKEHIEYVLRLKRGVQLQAKEALGYGSINTMRNKIKEYKIEIEDNNFDNS
jgi:DNA-binding NtrC family response regulator